MNTTPEIIKGIEIRKKADRIVILHTALAVGAVPPKGTVVIEYRLVYKDGTKSSFPVRYMDEIGSWNETIGGKESALNSSGSGETIQINGGNRFLYHFNIINQNPSKVIDTIEIESMGTTMAPYVMAITAE